MFFKQLLNASVCVVNPGQGPGGYGAFSGDKVCEVGIHPEWTSSLMQGTLVKHTLIHNLA